MLTANYTRTVPLDGIYLSISILPDAIQNRILGRETY
jgi:hypothetical protein